ncbi:COMM domain-containing protein 2 [Papilio machaon]|uniref:COMM domain-containing protein 2 n=1 Tax=Papilio machaon TaxID=76193 RepID=A0A194R7G2_PAPMA|nr:COMM domain-containing protein 2 [Papilio machaon]
MIIFLSELQKEHLDVLHKQSLQVLVDFCKLTIDYLNNGINNEKYTIAAEKLGIPLAFIQNLIQALAYLILEGCKHNLSQTDFKSSLALAGFSNEHQQVLLKLYITKKDELSSALNVLQQKEPNYQDLTWRFEVQMASRRCNNMIKPMITLNLVVTIPKNFGHNVDYKYKDDVKNLTPVQINSSIQNAKTASQCQRIINHFLLQCDLPNLIHLTNKLEQALKESKSQHVRKVQRAL